MGLQGHRWLSRFRSYAVLRLRDVGGAPEAGQETCTGGGWLMYPVSYPSVWEDPLLIGMTGVAIVAIIVWIQSGRK